MRVTRQAVFACVIVAALGFPLESFWAPGSAPLAVDMVEKASAKHTLSSRREISARDANDGIVVSNQTLPGTTGGVYYMENAERIVFSIVYDDPMADGGNLYRSHDDGKTWTMYNLGAAAANTIVGMVLSPADPTRAVVVGTSEDHWYTNDGGKTFQNFNTPDGQSVYDLDLHPTEKDYLLIGTRLATCRSVSTSAPCQSQWYLSTDFGSTFELLADYVKMMRWGYDANTIMAIIMSDQSGHNSNPNAVASNMVVSTNLWATQKTVVVGGLAFVKLDNYVLVAKYKGDTGSLQLQVARRTPAGAVGGFAVAVFTDAVFDEGQYTIVDTDEDSVFVCVKHTYDEACNVYVSDVRGTTFTLALENVFRDGAGRVDFVPVLGLDGVYIANKNTNPDKSARDSSLLKTLISFDDGGHWSFLRSADGSCSGLCSVNLHVRGIASRGRPDFPPLYTSAGAIGLIMAAGNLGDNLLFTHETSGLEQEALFFSRDAGLTWMNVDDGAFDFQFLDHGGLAIVLSDNFHTNTLSYSWDQGMSWTELQFASEQMWIQGVQADPQGKALSFLIYCFDGDYQDYVVHVDFSGMNERQCDGAASACPADDPSCPSDFELFTPSDGLSDGLSNDCLMGQTIAYVRRKRDAQCYIGEDHESHTQPVPCPCTREDYECDLGFESANSENPLADCVKVEDIPEDQPLAPDCAPGTRHRNATGYRLVAGTQCVGGIDLSATYDVCKDKIDAIVNGDSYDPTVRSSSALRFLVVVMFLGIWAFAIYVAVHYYRRRRLPPWLEDAQARAGRRCERCRKPRSYAGGVYGHLPQNAPDTPFDDDESDTDHAHFLGGSMSAKYPGSVQPMRASAVDADHGVSPAGMEAATLPGLLPQGLADQRWDQQ